VSRFKQPWVKTAIPKALKIELYRIMKDNTTQPTREIAVAKSEAIAAMSQELKKYLAYSRDTFKRLKSEMEEMPLSEVLSLPKELQDWILELRPVLRVELAKQGLKQHEGTPNWIDDHVVKYNELPLIPDCLSKLVVEYLPGARVSKGTKLTIPSAQYWNHELLPSQREQTLQLVDWLGLNRDDYVEMIKRHTPGRPS